MQVKCSGGGEGAGAVDFDLIFDIGMRPEPMRKQEATSSPLREELEIIKAFGK